MAPFHILIWTSRKAPPYSKDFRISTAGIAIGLAFPVLEFLSFPFRAPKMQRDAFSGKLRTRSISMGTCVDFQQKAPGAINFEKGRFCLRRCSGFHITVLKALADACRVHLCCR